MKLVSSHSGSSMQLGGFETRLLRVTGKSVDFTDLVGTGVSLGSALLFTFS